MNRMAAVFTRPVVQWLAVAFLCFLALPASASSLSPKDQRQIIEVVQAQLHAFAQDDAAKAFSYAAPNIKLMMGNAQNFLEMVRTQYEVVYKPSSTTFMQPIGEAGEALLMVRMTDDDGSAWIATYTLHKQKNKAWLISGCAVSEATGTAV
jgi:hypothetical protein